MTLCRTFPAYTLEAAGRARAGDVLRALKLIELQAEMAASKRGG